MAAKQAFYAEPYSARHAKAFDGLVGVLGARRFKAARACDENRQVRLVQAERKKRYADAERWQPAGRESAVADRLNIYWHCGSIGYQGLFNSLRSSVVSTVNGAVTTLDLGCMTMSHPAEIS